VAIYFMNAQVIGRSAGRTATGAAAYRAGERIHDERTGQTFDYTRRRGDIETETLAPAGAPEWVHDRAQLWNQVEKAERRGDAQLAREIVVAIPQELDREQQRAVVREYVQEQFVAKGMVADVAIHRNPGNPHAHIMLTMREMGPDGLAAKKNRDWNKPELLEKWREQWAVAANHALERAGREARIDHRSLAEQGLERMPQVHLGPHSAALERRGIQTEKGDHNRVVAEHNAVVIELDKLREEKRELELRKAVNDRYQERLGAGWRNEHAFALGQLEWLMGGKPLTQDDVNRLRQEQQDELRSIERQVDHLINEDHRLRRAEPIIVNRDKAALEVERLKSPMATVKRWFSAEARNEFQSAVKNLDRLNAHASMEGVFSQADLRAQRTAWEEKWAQVPELDKRAEGIKETLGRASLAVDGFRQEQARARERSEAHGRALDDLAWERQRNRERDRGMDRGR
jgi:ATP-dependent exoDNAse (exonuclease V) alpha subunit